MKIAVIGGGSAGLVTAHLLDGVHEVSLFEKAPILGGNVRTLGGNVACDALDPGMRLDAGVIEFEKRNFPTLMRLFDQLGCVTRPVPGTTTFWSWDGVHHVSPGSLARSDEGFRARIRHLVDLVGLQMQAAVFDRRTDLPREALEALTLGDLLTDHVMDRWAALLTTYAYSIPYERVREVPAGLAIPTLRAFERAEGWVSLCGGAWDYHDRILQRFGGKVFTDAHVLGVTRDRDGVELAMATGDRLRFDKVVFAAPPDQTLAILDDPTDAEVRRFGAWRANHAHVLIHHDPGLYARRGVSVKTEFDLVETGPGQGGYNAWLNALCGVPEDDPRDFGLAFGLDDAIDPDHVIHRQDHHTPDYTTDAWRWHAEVQATNGEHHTLHAGAWLGDGLQEGAVCSAVAVSRLLGGAEIQSE